MRLNFPSGMELSADDRKDLSDRLRDLQRVTTGENLAPTACSKARLSLLTKLLLGYPVAGGGTETAAEARLSFYLEAVSDIAPWALDAAIKRWVRGDIGKGNVDFAPSPGALRRLCEEEIEPFETQMFILKRLLSAIPMERAMDPKPIAPEEKPQEFAAPRLKVIS